MHLHVTKRFGICLIATMLLVMFTSPSLNKNFTHAQEAHNIESIDFTYTTINGGIGYEQGVTRRDPSDIIKVGNTYYVFYTKNPASGYSSGYWGEIYFAKSTDNGYTWQEVGRAVARGAEGEWDSFSVYTPNIIESDGVYYLFYTAVGGDFDWTTASAYDARNYSHIGVATATNIEGPYTKYTNNPVLSPSPNTSDFDSFKVDDASLGFDDNGDILMFYKGRKWGEGPGTTKMGVMSFDYDNESFVRLNSGNYVQDEGHEVMVWEYDDGFYSLSDPISGIGTLFYSDDGLDFEEIYENIPKNIMPWAPGFYKPELSGLPVPVETMDKWGVSMTGGTSRVDDLYLERVEMTIETDQSMDISTVGDGTGYDDTVTDYLSTSVNKTMDADGDNVYGTAGYFMFGSDSNDYNDMRESVDKLPSWITASGGADLATVTKLSSYTDIDDPNATSASTVANWGQSGIALSTTSGTDFEELFKFTIGTGTPEHFRVGVMAGNESTADGRWDPQEISLQGPGGISATVSSLPATHPGLGWVFFDIDTKGATVGTFTISAKQRYTTQGPSIGGVTFDVLN